MTKTEYEWVNGNMANQVLRKTIFVVEDDDNFKESTPVGFIMKSGATTYVAWLATDKQNHTGNRMEFYDMDTAKAWVFTQVRMNDSSASLITN